MKARYIRDDIAVSKATALALFGEEFVEANTHQQVNYGRPVLCWKRDTVLECFDAWRAVQMGWAVPADDECGAAAGLSIERMQAAQRQYAAHRRQEEKRFRRRGQMPQHLSQLGTL